MPQADKLFHSAHQDIQVTFIKDGDGKVSGLVWKADGKERKAPRMGPLFHSLKPQPDPDPARTKKVVAGSGPSVKAGRLLPNRPWLRPARAPTLRLAVPRET